MGTDIRPEISKKSKYYISKHRYYELKHFVQQYPDWVKELREIDSLTKRPVDHIISNDISDPVLKAVEKRVELSRRIKLITDASNQTDKIIGIYILTAVINNESYERINARSPIPCCREVYYELYRKFFWLLDQARK